MRRKSGCIAWGVIIAALAVLFLAWQYASFRQAGRVLPEGMTMASLDVGGMSREQALNALEVAFATPLDVVYQGQHLPLAPDSVELYFDSDATAANLDAALAKSRGLDGFIAYVLRRPQEPIAVPVAVGYSEERLDGFLTRVAQQYDQPPQPPVPLPTGLTISPGQPGYTLDITASRPLVGAALLSAAQQQVTLTVQTAPPPPLTMDVLEELLRAIAGGHADLVTGIFVKDLQTGEELGINAEVAYAGLSVLKIAILEETYRYLDPPLSAEVSDWLSDTLGVTSSNFKANLLLQNVIGGGDGYQGAENLTTSMNYLGLVNTFMVAPYDEEANGLFTIVTQANSRTDITTNPDPYMQTTPLDIGLLLEMIYQCSQGGGALMVAYPDDFTADECQQMIEWLTGDRIDSLIEAGVPVGTRIAHKHGFAGDTHADAAIIFSPGGDFVLVIYVYRPEWLEWEESAPYIANIATATYNYFNPQ